MSLNSAVVSGLIHSTFWLQCAAAMSDSRALSNSLPGVNVVLMSIVTLRPRRISLIFLLDDDNIVKICFRILIYFSSIFWGTAHVKYKYGIDNVHNLEQDVNTSLAQFVYVWVVPVRKKCNVKILELEDKES